MYSTFVHFSGPLLCAQSKDEKKKTKRVSPANDLSEMKGHAQKYPPLYLGSCRCELQRLNSELY